MNDYSNDPDFERILNLQPKDIERPQPLPAGLYLCAIKDRYELVKSTQKGTPGVQFVFHVIGVIGKVNMTELEAAGGYQGKTIYHTFWLPAESPDGTKGRQDWRIHQFLDNCEVPSGMMRERLDATIGAQFGADIRPDAKSDTPRNIIFRTFKPQDHEDDPRLPLNSVPKAPTRPGRR